MSTFAFASLLLAVLAVCAVVGVQLSNALDRLFMERYFPKNSTLSGDSSVDGPRPAPAVPLRGAGREADQ